jgi:hypothetical protein
MTDDAAAKADRRTFTRAKLAWLDHVQADHTLPHLWFRAAYVVSTFINQTAGCAWPAQRTIAERLGVKIRAVQFAIGGLADRGHLIVEYAKGRGQTNVLHPAIKGERIFTLPEQKRRTAKQERVHGEVRKGARSFVQNTLKNTSKNTVRASEEDLEFKRWLSYYPRQQPIGSAEFYYRELISTGQSTHQQLVDEALRTVEATPREHWDNLPTPEQWLERKLWPDRHHRYEHVPTEGEDIPF